MPAQFYTYLWLREDGTPYYAGKGMGIRAYRSHRMGKAPSRDRILVQDFASEQDALVAEMFLIAAYGREDQGTGCLLNLTDGGENPPNHKGMKRSEHFKENARQRRHTLASLALMSAKQMARFMNKENHPLFGKHRSTATKNKISKAHEGMKYSAAPCETLSKVGKELAKSPEVLARLRANARLGAIARWGSKETTCLPN